MIGEIVELVYFGAGCFILGSVVTITILIINYY